MGQKHGVGEDVVWWIHLSSTLHPSPELSVAPLHGCRVGHKRTS